MKYLPLFALAALLVGCKHSEFDVSPAQVAHKFGMHGAPGGPHGIDLKHLPPGAVKHEHVYHKGDQMPDGSIADGDRKVVTVEMNHPDDKGGAHGQIRMVDTEITKGN